MIFLEYTDGNKLLFGAKLQLHVFYVDQRRSAPVLISADRVFLFLCHVVFIRTVASFLVKQLDALIFHLDPVFS